jgi:hypothetical protein
MGNSKFHSDVQIMNNVYDEAENRLRTTNKIQADPHVSAGAFGSMKVSQEITALHYSFMYNINDALHTTSSVNGGTITQSGSFAVVSTSTNTAGSASLNSRDTLKYVPGQGVMTRWTSIFTQGVANSTQEVGLNGHIDGLMFGYSGSQFGIFHKNNSSQTFIPQSEWSVDRCSWLIPTFGNVYGVSYQWLGFGFIRFFVEDPEEGVMKVVHEIKYPNKYTVTSLSNPTMGLHMAVKNWGNNTDIRLAVPSFGATIEAQENTFGLLGSSRNRKTGITPLTNVLTIKNTTTFQSKVNRVKVQLNSLSVSVGSGDAYVGLYLNSTLGGVPSYTDFNTNQSTISTDVAGTTVVGGRRLMVFSFEANSSQLVDLAPYEIHLNPGDILTIGAESVGGNTTCNASINWREEF